MNAKELLGKKIIDKKARDLAKLAEINLNTKTFVVSNIYGSVGNPISRKYIDIPVSNIITVGDYIQISGTAEEYEDKKLEKIPDSEAGIVKLNNFIGKTILDCEGNIAGKVSNVDIDVDSNKIISILLEGSSSGFGKPKSQKSIGLDDIASIGDYMIINKVFTEEDESANKDAEKEEEDEESVKINVE